MIRKELLLKKVWFKEKMKLDINTNLIYNLVGFTFNTILLCTVKENQKCSCVLQQYLSTVFSKNVIEIYCIKSIIFHFTVNKSCFNQNQTYVLTLQVSLVFHSIPRIFLLYE